MLALSLPASAHPGLAFWAPLTRGRHRSTVELDYDYRVLKGLILTPTDRTSGGETSTYLPAVEIAGELLESVRYSRWPQDNYQPTRGGQA